MSFRKRSLGVPPSQSSSVANDPSSSSSTLRAPHAQPPTPAPGIRPSPIDGRPTTSTGTSTLDNLLAGHAGLALGNSLLVEETGATDYGGLLARCFAAEGIVQGHNVIVGGVGRDWGRGLPGVATSDRAKGRAERVEGTDSLSSGVDAATGNEKMKIAWRYEGMGLHGAERNAVNRAPPTLDDTTALSTTNNAKTTATPPSEPFNHTFDLAKRLTHPNLANHLHFYPFDTSSTTTNPFPPLLIHLTQTLVSSARNQVHRLILPSLLSPAIYPPHASEPTFLLQFLHALRALLRRYSSNLAVFITLPLDLHPRATGLIRWAEHLVDGVIELQPFPHDVNVFSSSSSSAASSSEKGRSGAATAQEEHPQGMLRVHKLPVWHERGGGGAGAGAAALGDDMAFVVSRRRFEVRAFSLPPEDGEEESQQQSQEKKNEGMEF